MAFIIVVSVIIIVLVVTEAQADQLITMPAEYGDE